MKVIVARQFEKDTEKELNKPLQLKMVTLIEELQQLPSLIDIKNLKKLKGYKNAYRIKMGEYELDFFWKQIPFRLSRVMHRKEIYRYFP